MPILFSHGLFSRASHLPSVFGSGKIRIPGKNGEVALRIVSSFRPAPLRLSFEFVMQAPDSAFEVRFGGCHDDSYEHVHFLKEFRSIPAPRPLGLGGWLCVS